VLSHLFFKVDGNVQQFGDPIANYRRMVNAVGFAPKKGIFFFFVKNTHKKERKEKKKQKKRAPTPIIIRIANDKIRKNIETKIRPFFLVAKKNVL